MRNSRRLFAAFTVVLLMLLWGCAVPHPSIIHRPPSPEIVRIINHYVEAVEGHENALRGATMKVDITAAIPKLKEHGTLRALRKISQIGQITYQLLGFQGSDTVKSQVIARYLKAERKEQGNQKVDVLPSNYKFKYKGEKDRPNGGQAYVFDVSPWKKREGLFKGQIWLDKETYLPVFEKGKLVKSPGLFLKKIEFERGYRIQNGISVPEYLTSTIHVRLFGKVELNVHYSDFQPKPGSPSSPASTADSPSPLSAHAIGK
ncbi:MAG: hypothetical protein ACRD45_06210 [Bryobacteraceae bacterium]